MYTRSFLFAICVIGKTLSDLNFMNPKDAKNKHLLVSLDDGQIYGKQATTIGEGSKYYSFLGIPFAKPPLKNLRFKPPQKTDKWKGILDCTKDRSECFQQQKPVTGSEDCLYINVYTPKLKGKFPVMVWIYGGLYDKGNSSYKLFGPDFLLEKDVTFVSFNYRLGIFGFLSTEDLAAPGNIGLKDQAFALEWIKRNIASFGGNPNKITIFGQGAGGASVSYMLQSPKTKNLFEGAIIQNGHSLNPWALSRNSKTAAFEIGKRLGISTNNSTTLVEQLKLVDALQLQRVAGQVQSSATLATALEGLIFAPVIEPQHHEAFFTGKSYELLSEGNFHRVPTMIGFNSNGTLPSVDLIASVREYMRKSYDYSKENIAPRDLTDDMVWRMMAGMKIKQHYVESSIPFSRASDSKIYQFIVDDLYVRGIREAAIQQSRYADVYFYKFTYCGYLGLEGTRSIKEEELPYIFRSYVNENLVSASDRLTRSRVIRLWTNFAKYGNPSPRKDKLLGKTRWNKTGSNRDDLNVLNIGLNLEMQKNPDEVNMKFYDRIYEEYGDNDYDTY